MCYTWVHLENKNMEEWYASKGFKKLIKNMPDDREILISDYKRVSGKTVIKYTNQCCNTEHQEENNELWLSNEGLVKV